MSFHDFQEAILYVAGSTIMWVSVFCLGGGLLLAFLLPALAFARIQMARGKH